MMLGLFEILQMAQRIDLGIDPVTGEIAREIIAKEMLLSKLSDDIKAIQEENFVEEYIRLKKLRSEFSDPIEQIRQIIRQDKKADFEEGLTQCCCDWPH